MWTEFFDSELWSRTILQLSHTEPAIKHGILALSTMHERYESIAPIFTTDTRDFAFVQYMQAVKHSKELLNAHQMGTVSLEMVLIACIIFTCYENLAGNYYNASMHLRNGLRILKQHRSIAGTHSDVAQSAIANVLYRFDLQAMTFSDNASRYDYKPSLAPTCPPIQVIYKTNNDARDDLVNLLRCMMWLAGMAEQDPQAAEHPIWLNLHQEMMVAFGQWESTFAEYLANMPPHEQRDTKIYAGNTLLKISAMTFHIIMNSGAGLKSEMAWDPFIDSFKTIVDLAETIPIIQPAATRTASSSPTPSSSSPGTPRAPEHRLLAPNPATITPTPPSAISTFVWSQSSHPVPPTGYSNPNASSETPRISKQTPSFFSPSFELSSVVPLFIVACRCRDPVIRRRAIALLLSSRRREGVWDSVGAGMVAAQCMTKEENLPPHLHLDDDILRRNPNVQSCVDVPESARVRDILVEVKVVEGRIDLVYSMTTGEASTEQQVIYESRGDGMLEEHNKWHGN
jgi:hypothetical protein